MANFVHLHCHTEYSLLDGLSKISKMTKRAKELEMPAVAITDHGSMYGVIEFYKACQSEQIKPIVGCEVYVAPRSHTSKEGKIDADPYHLTLLAKNYQGYLNLMKLVSAAHLDGFYYKPRVDKELLKQFHEGIICLSACPAGEFIRSLENDDTKKATEVAKTYLEIFGQGNYYFELQNHEYNQLLKKTNMDASVRTELEKMARIQDLTWQVARELSPKLGIPLVATNDFHYINEDDAEAQDALVCVQTGKFISDSNRLRMIDTPNLYMKSTEEMATLFKDLPEALETPAKIAQLCDLEIPMGVPRFPIFEIPDKSTPMDYLRTLTYQRAEGRLELTAEIKERLDYELGIIEKKNYPTYFLVVQDFINWANEQGIITNTRGSAAGSLVLFALGVTKINPMLYKIPFERFLNPERPSLPDIDADIADDRREEVIEYVTKKYGQSKVANIVTFGTMLGRAAIRDIGRVLGLPYGEIDQIAKLVPMPKQGFHKSLEESIRETPELTDFYKNNPTMRKMLDLAIKVDGTVRHASVHAAGVVIGPDDIINFSPLQREANGDKLVTQYEMHAVEDVGLVKMDFLGIRNLSILGRALEYVAKNQNIKVDLDNIPLDDVTTYKLLARGETMGIFQMGSSGMTKWLMELNPTKITDLSAMVALYRPGPMGSIPEYIERAHDPSKIKYFDPRMEEYMQQSLGLLVYQEDVLLTAINIAGYSWLEADKFRKAMGKKIPAEMAKQKDQFINGAIDKGMVPAKAQELWGLIEPFAAYGFPKAHAASYAIVSYQTAYMKANFPVEFMAAVMTAEYGDTDKIAQAVDECKKMGLVVLPPDVNKSEVGFSIEGKAIRFGLSAIKNVGISAIESIISARQTKPFIDILDLCARVDNRLANKKTLESLIKAGGLDQFGSRAAQLAVLDDCLDRAHKQAKSVASGQTSLFDDSEEMSKIQFALPDIPELTMEQLLASEKDLLGFYLHEPPFLKGLKLISRYTTLQIAAITEEDLNKKLTIGGVIMEVKRVFTKKSNAEMAFLKVFDGTAEIDCVIFPKTFAETKDFLIKEQVVIIKGKIDLREDAYSLVADTIELFSEETSDAQTVLSAVEVAVPASADRSLLQELNHAIKDFPGDYPITVLIGRGQGSRKIDLPYGVRPDNAFIDQVEKLLGKESIRLI